MPPPDEIVRRYFQAMRRGAGAESELLALFADDAVYAEPFSGLPPARGIEAIAERFRLGWEFPLPDLELEVLEVEIDGGRARSVWECRSPGLDGPSRGEDVYVVEGGRIVRLDVRLLTGESPD